MRTFKQLVGSLCFLPSLFLGLALLASPFSFAKGTSSGSAAGLQFGQVWPAGYIGSAVDSAIAPGLFYEYQASEIFGLKTDLTRSKHTNDDLVLKSLAIDLKANLIYYDQLVPYAFFGMGLYGVDKRIPDTTRNASKTLFGMNFGFGADLNLTDTVFVGMDFTVHNLFSGIATLDNGSTQEISGRWSGFFMRGGVRF